MRGLAEIEYFNEIRNLEVGIKAKKAKMANQIKLIMENVANFKVFG